MADTLSRNLLFGFSTEYDGSGASKFKIDMDDLTAKSGQVENALKKQSAATLELDISKRRLMSSVQMGTLSMASFASGAGGAAAGMRGAAVAAGFLGHSVGQVVPGLGLVILLASGIAEGLLRFGEGSEKASDKLAKLNEKVDSYKTLAAEAEKQAKAGFITDEQAAVMEHYAKATETAAARLKVLAHAQALQQQMAELQATETGWGSQMKQFGLEVLQTTAHVFKQADATFISAAAEQYATGAMNKHTEEIKKAQAARDALMKEMMATLPIEQELAKHTKEETDAKIKADKDAEAAAKRRDEEDAHRIQRMDEENRKEAEGAEYVKKLQREVVTDSLEGFEKRRAKADDDEAAEYVRAAKLTKNAEQREAAIAAIEAKYAGIRKVIEHDMTKAAVHEVEQRVLAATAGAAIILRDVDKTASLMHANFKVMKRIHEAEAVVAGITAVVHAYKDGAMWGGVISGSIEAGIAAIAVGAEIAALEKTEPGSTSTPSAPSASSPTISTPGTPPLPPSTGPLAPATPGDQGQFMGAPSTIHIHVQAIDPSSFTPLTQQRIGRLLVQAMQNQTFALGGTL
jgi:hypothetical protein